MKEEYRQCRGCKKLVPVSMIQEWRRFDDRKRCVEGHVILYCECGNHWRVEMADDEVRKDRYCIDNNEQLSIDGAIELQ